MSVRIIGPACIADEWGTYEPGVVIDNPSPSLLALAEARTINPETSELYCEIVPNSGEAPLLKQEGSTPRRSSRIVEQPTAELSAPEPEPENT